MGGLSGNLANYGLITQGMDSASLQEQNMSDLQQHARLRGQQIETGDIGLEDVRRTKENEASYRNAVSSSSPDSGTMGIYHNVSDAALKGGDFGTYDQARKASLALQQEGWGQIAVGALTGAPPEQVEKNFNATGVSKMVPGSLEYGRDPKTGDIIASAINVQDGKRYPFNATQYARLHGLIKTDPIKLGPNEKAITQGGTEIGSNPVDQFKATGNIIYNSKTGAWQNTDPGGEWKLGTIVEGNNERTVEINSKTGAINRLGSSGARTNLEAKVHQPTIPGGPLLITMPGGGVAEFKPATEATPGKVNWLSANEPGKPAQPATVESIAQTQPEKPPVEGARKAADGRWYVRDGDGYRPVVPRPAQNLSGEPAAPASKRQEAPAPADTVNKYRGRSDDDLVRAYEGATSASKQQSLDARLRKANEQEAQALEAELKSRGVSVESVKAKRAQVRAQTDEETERTLKRQQPGGKQLGLEPQKKPVPTPPKAPSVATTPPPTPAPQPTPAAPRPSPKKPGVEPQKQEGKAQTKSLDRMSKDELNAELKTTRAQANKFADDVDAANDPKTRQAAEKRNKEAMNKVMAIEKELRNRSFVSH